MSAMDLMRAERQGKELMRSFNVMRKEVTQLKKDVAGLQERIRQLELQARKKTP